MKFILVFVVAMALAIPVKSETADKGWWGCSANLDGRDVYSHDVELNHLDDRGIIYNYGGLPTIPGHNSR